jgi:hypothetical protein
MAGRFADIHPLALQSWRSDQRVWDRQMWDPYGFGLAIACTVLERWVELEESLQRLDDVAGHGGVLCAALAEGIREEMTAAGGKRHPQHAQLNRLGYHGLSELLSYRSKVSV